jgi:arylsulfatase A-like enzyme
MAAYILSAYRPNLLTVHFLSVDDAGHRGADTPALREALASVDAAIGYLSETIDALGISDKTVLLVVGDHGFIDAHTLLAPDVWLVEAGLRGPEKNRGNWKATFHTRGGSAFLHLRDPDDTSTLNRVMEMLDHLPTEVRVRFEVIAKERLTELSADPNAVLALAARPGTAFSGATEPPAIRPGAGATHGFLPDAAPGIYTGLVVRGPGIRSGASVPEISLADIAPLVAHLLALDLEKIDGSLPDALMLRDLEDPTGE